MRKFRRSHLVTVAGLVVAASLAAVAGPARPAGAVSTACPWVGSSAPIGQRVSMLQHAR